MTTKANVASSSSSSLSGTVWYEDPMVLLDADEMWNIVPSGHEDTTSQTNAIMRFALYFTVILVLVRRSVDALFALVVAGAFTYVLHRSHEDEDAHREELMERLDVQKTRPGESASGEAACVRPTRDNPFMNVMLTDLKDFPNRPSACHPNHKAVKKNIDKHFSHNLFRDVDDAFGRSTSSRQFYTMPSTTVPNDRDALARWLYQTPPTCKEGNLERCTSSLYTPPMMM